VSHLRICSRTAEQAEAYELLCDPDAAPGNPQSTIPAARALDSHVGYGGPTLPGRDPDAAAGGRQSPISDLQSEISNPLSPRPCAAPPGTTVEVRHLFFNVPARRKFLRQPATELSHVTEQLARLALAHPRIAFTLTHNDRPARNLPPTDSRRTRIGDFYGTDLAACLLHANRQGRGLAIEALIAPPDESRASSKWQYLFLNGRYITDRRLGYAVREAFRGLVEHDRYPVVFIFITISPDQFDVNVHPTKIEVRWRDAGLIQSEVLAVLRETLLSHDLTPRLFTGGASPGAASVDLPHQQRARQALADYLQAVDPTQARLEFRPPRFPAHSLRPSIASTFAPPREERREYELPGSGTTRLAGGESAGPPAVPADVASSSSAGASVAFDAASLGLPASSFLQVHNTYIVAQTEEGIIIVDQHALHERILYERFRHRLLAGPLEAQRLLMPQALQVSPRQAQAAEQHLDILRRLGIELDSFGPDTLAVQAFPTLLHNVEIEGFVLDLLDKLAEAERADTEEAHLHAALDMMACKAAVKAGDPLTPEEMQALLAQRHLVDKSSNCPHGRPTTLQLSTRDLEKQFKRV
jgi:DNA mismatch repair protein MutL